ncbi:hypothetical protein J7M28_07020 [bacterium]|nr:hypothetical protein [bacterium]
MGNTEENRHLRRFADPNRPALILDDIRLAISGRFSRDVLTSLGSAIKQCDAAIGKARASGDDEYAEAVTDDECEVVENLIGVAFVMCQVVIEAVVSIVIHLHERVVSDGHVLPTCSKKKDRKKCLLQLGRPLAEHPEYIDVRVIDVFANYFKHRSREDYRWDNIMSDVGASDGCTGNMRRAAEVLGLANYANLELLGDKVSNWADEVIAKYKSELKDPKLI